MCLLAQLSHDLVISGAIYQHTLTDLRLPDSGWNSKMISSSSHLRTILLYSLPETGRSLVIMGVTVTMHGGQNRTTPDDGIHQKGIRLERSAPRDDVSSGDVMLIFA